MPTSDDDLLELAGQLRELAENVRSELGCGFDESILQNAFAIELRDHNIEYLKEVNIEIFYRGQQVGVDRPDFVITKVGGHAESIIVDLKQTTGRTPSADNRAQLKSYCTSFPLNSNPVLTNFSGGILLIFPKSDIDNSGAVKLFVVNRQSHAVRDEQRDDADARKANAIAKRQAKAAQQKRNREEAKAKKKEKASGAS